MARRLTQLVQRRKRRTLRLQINEDELLDASEDINNLLTAPPKDTSPAFLDILMVLDDAITDAFPEPSPDQLRPRTSAT